MLIMKIRRPRNAFTLLEIMIVVTIIAVLMGTAIYKLKNNIEYARMQAVGTDIQSVGTQLKLYESMNGFYPTTDQGLQALVAQPDTDPKPSRWLPLFEKVPQDPWHNNYIYRCPGTKHPQGYDLFSAGPDRIPDTADDDWGGG
jgi:general secretion pathway protein G